MCSKITKSELWRLQPILAEDDPKKLEAFLAAEKEVYLSEYPDLFKECIMSRAKKCAFYLLSGNVARGYYSRSDVLEQALSIHYCDPEIIEVLFQYFDGKEFANTYEYSQLPIHYFLNELTDIHPLCTWARDDSLVKLLILLCDPQLKKKLDCARLVADYTHPHSLVDIAASFLSNGEVAELAALLLVAHTTVLQPLKSGLSKKSLSLMKDMNGMVSQAIRGKLPNPSGLGLVHIFDKAGDSLRKFYTSMLEDISGQDLIKGVAEILIHDAKISISEEDVDLAGILSVDLEIMPSIHESLGIKPKDSIDKSQKPVFRFPSVNSADHLNLTEPAAVSMTKVLNSSTAKPKRAIKTQSKHKIGKHLYSTAAFQSPRISTNSQAWFTLPPTSTLRGMASLAMRLKRGIRFL